MQPRLLSGRKELKEAEKQARRASLEADQILSNSVKLLASQQQNFDVASDLRDRLARQLPSPGVACSDRRLQ